MPSSEAPRGHSLLAPSSASRWSVCTASVGFIEAHRLELDFSSSEQADEGTDAHAMANSLLRAAPIPALKYDNPEMRSVVARFVKFVDSLRLLGTESAYEVRVPLFYSPQDHGTIDVRIINRWKKIIYIVDLKYGAGVSVSAKNNKQLATYAESALREIEGVDDTWMIDLIIYQPRDRSDDEPVRQWALRRRELAQFCADEIGWAAKSILGTTPEGIAPRRIEFVADPSGHCYFCPAKGICEAYRNYGLSALPDETKDLGPAFPRIPEPKMLTREQRNRVIAGRKALEQWLEAVEDFEVAQLMHGAEPMGHKLVEGKSNRAWSDPEKVARILGEYLDPMQIVIPAEPSLVSVSDAEKLIGKKEFASLSRFITKPPGKPTLVPVDDKRPALTFGPARDFEDLDAKPGSAFI